MGDDSRPCNPPEAFLNVPEYIVYFMICKLCSKKLRKVSQQKTGQLPAPHLLSSISFYILLLFLFFNYNFIQFVDVFSFISNDFKFWNICFI